MARRRSGGSGVGSVTQAVTALVALGALVFTGLSLKVTQSQNAAQNDLAAQSQYTDRYTKAVDQLGQQGLEKQQIRLGGIYALERLTRDSPRDQPTIIEVLSSFVRTAHSPATGEGACPRPSVDVQAALSVLGRRDPGHDNRTYVDLRGACLDHVDLTGAKLAGADLSGAHLMEANLNFAYLNGANLLGANLGLAHLSEANLTDANLDNADLTGASLGLAHLSGVSLRANLTRANLRGAHAAKAVLAGANLTDGLLAGADLTDAVLSGADLTRVNLSYAKLIRAKLSFATPTMPGLTEADLRFADLTGADLTDANLSGANLTDAVHNWETRVDGTVTNSRTRGKWW